MKALIELNEGDRLYRSAVSQWLRDEDGALVFKVISKLTKDRAIEFVCYTQRSDGIKRVIQHIEFAEEDFWRVMDTLESSLVEFFPGIKFSVQNIDLDNPIGLRVMKYNRINSIRLRALNWFESKINSFKTLFHK